MSKETDIAWLAGFWEGEGCISYTFSRSRRALTLCVSQKNSWPIFKAQQVIAEHLEIDSLLYQRKSGLWDLKLSEAFKIDRVCEAMWSFLSPRRRIQIQETMANYEDDFYSLVGNRKIQYEFECLHLRLVDKEDKISKQAENYLRTHCE